MYIFTTLSRLYINYIDLQFTFYFTCTACYLCVQLISYGSYICMYCCYSVKPDKVDLKFMSGLFLKSVQAGDRFSIFIISFGPPDQVASY